MAIRSKHLGLIAGLALTLSVSAATEWPVTTAEPAATPKQHQAVTTADDASPVPAPVLFLAGGLLGLAAYLRWRQRGRT